MSVRVFIFQARALDGLTNESGALTYVVRKGTTTPVIVYTDSGLTIPATNPQVANALGLVGPLYWNDSVEAEVTFKVKTNDAATVLLQVDYAGGAFSASYIQVGQLTKFNATYTADGAQTKALAGKVVSSPYGLNVFFDGIIQPKDNYTVTTDGTDSTITWATNCQPSSSVVVYYEAAVLQALSPAVTDYTGVDISAASVTPTGGSADTLADHLAAKLTSAGGDGSAVVVTPAGGSVGDTLENFFAVTLLSTSYATLPLAVAAAISTGKRLILVGANTITADLTINGSIDIEGLPGSKIVASGSANAVILSGAIPRVRIKGVEFEDFPRSAIWLADNSTVIDELIIEKCVGTDNRVFLSAQQDQANASYDIDEYHPANTNTLIKKLRVTGCDVSGGKSGIALSCLTRNAFVQDNDIYDLTNTTNTGSTLEHGVFGIRIFIDGLTAEGSGKYNDFYDDQYSISVDNNRIRNLTQTIATKGVNAIIVSGFDVSVTDNKLRNVYSTQSSDGADANNMDAEAIYVKAARVVITGNTGLNAGGSEAAINIKGQDLSTEAASSLTSAPGHANIVAFNNFEWDGATVPHTITGISVQASPCKIFGNEFRGLTQYGVIVHGVTVSGKTFEAIEIYSNYWEGTHSDAIILRGGVQSISNHHNTNVITGGTGNCTFANLTQARGTLWKNISIKLNTHRVVTRTGASTYNAFVRAAFTEYAVSNLSIEENTIDHYVSGQANKGVYLQGDADGPVTKLVCRNNTWPAEMGSDLFYSDAFHVEYLFDEYLEYSTTNNTPVNVFNARVGDNAVCLVEFDLIARDNVDNFVGAYHKKAVYKRTTGALSLTGSVATLLEAEGDAAWDAAPSFSGAFARVAITGDATNPVEWSGRIKIHARPFA